MSAFTKDTVVIYHANCRDGFGAAYAAWKKFGEEADYHPAEYDSTPPEGLADKDVYIVDFSYPRETLEELDKVTKSLMVIDHHQTSENAVMAIPGSIFDPDHSGAVLTWRFFHPDTDVPELLRYIEDHDIYRFKLANNHEYNLALGFYPMTFEAWDLITEKLKDPANKDGFLARGKLINKYEQKLARDLMQYKELVSFEGHEVWALNADRTHRSVLANRLAGLNLEAKKEPIGIVYYHIGGMWHVSLRSHGDTDVEEIARKYGGGGHINAASFRVKNFSDLPFTFIE